MVNAKLTPTEELVRISRRSMVALFVVVVMMGALGLSLAFSPRGAVSGPGNLYWWLAPSVMIVVAAVLRWLGGRRLHTNSPEVDAVMQDEWRQSSLNRAARIALTALLLSQAPLAIVFGFLTQLPAPRLAIGMAVTSMTIGLTVLIATQVILDWE